MNTAWHFTTWLDAFDHWQALLAGLLGFGAAIVVVAFTLQSERRKSDRELEALRRSLGVEVRQCISIALGTFRSLKKVAQTQNGPITTRMIENVAYFQKPVVYPAVADKIGLLGPQAMDVVIIYGLLETVRSSVDRIMRYRTPDDITPAVVASTANALIVACRAGLGIILALKTNVPAIDERDSALAGMIGDEATAWTVARQAWPEIQASEQNI